MAKHLIELALVVVVAVLLRLVGGSNINHNIQVLRVASSW
jgi:hypothetical protein